MELVSVLIVTVYITIGTDKCARGVWMLTLAWILMVLFTTGLMIIFPTVYYVSLSEFIIDMVNVT